MASRRTKKARAADTRQPVNALHEGLAEFAASLTAKLTAHAAGEPEDQLKAPVDKLLKDFAAAIGIDLVAKGESQLEGRLGRPDFVILIGGVQVGHIELKAPGKGANPAAFRGHDKEQWGRFANLPNLIYTDGAEWGLYREGELRGKRVRLSGDAHTDGSDAVGDGDAADLLHLLGEFASWTPVIPKSAKALAQYLAPFCRLIREEVLDALATGSRPVASIREDVKQLLFPDADDDRFADAYAQTVVFALLLARIEGASTLDLDDAIRGLSHGHTLLSRSLKFLTDDAALAEIATSVALAQRVINEVDPRSLRTKPGAAGPWLRGRETERDIEGRAPKVLDPWLYFYEDFLAAYDPKLRNEAGAYYTPVEVVRCQVRLIDDILRNRFDRPHGFVENDVITLDPGLTETLADAYGFTPSPEDIAGYLYGVLAQPAYTERFATELQRREVRVPWTKDADLFREVSTLGRRLIFLHTYGERCVPRGGRRGSVPRGEARNTKAVPDAEDAYPETFGYDAQNGRLTVGGGAFEPVAPEVYEFEVSGLKVVQSWLGYRMKSRKGRKSSPLDDIRPRSWTRQFTTELLELLWVLEATVAGYPNQEALLDRVLAGELFTGDEFPEVPDESRKPPKVPRGDGERLFGE